MDSALSSGYGLADPGHPVDRADAHHPATGGHGGQTRASALVTRGHGPRNARTLPRRAARRALTAVPAARSDRTGGARAAIRGDRLRRVARLLRQVPTTGGSYHDPQFERPDLVEDDYYQFRNQPPG